jgi:hypothetical protein
VANDNGSAPAGDSEYFGREIHAARQLHKEWARAQLNGLPDDAGAITEWIKLTQGQRPDLAAELASAGITAAEAGLRPGYGSRPDARRATIFTRYRNRQINRSEVVTEVWQWRRHRNAG